MSDISDLDEGSVVEYSLAELGFVLVFVLLLLSGWEINSNAANLEEEAKSRAELQRQLEASEKEKDAFKSAIAMLPPGETEFPDDFMFVDKKEYLALQAQANDADQVIEKIAPALENLEPSILSAITEMASSIESPPNDPLIVSESDQKALEETLDKLEQDNKRMSEELASIAKNTDTLNNDGGKIGTIGFCTYEPPKSDSDKVYGKSVALGTLLVEEDGITLLAKNSAIQHRNFVDIAGEEYDTTLVAEAVEKWPLNKKLSAREFTTIGYRFVEIGDLPSDKRVECRFGMDYYVPIYSNTSAAMLKNVLEGSFYKNWEVDENSITRLLPDFNFSSKKLLEKSPPIKDKATPETNSISTNASSNISRPVFDPQVSYTEPVAISPIKVLSRATPIFPKTAQRRGVIGTVELTYKVSTYGRATGINVTKEEPRGYDFGKASVAALEQYKFKPASKNGIPVVSEKQKLRFRF